MQFKSERQKQWANSPEGIKSLGKDRVDAANQTSSTSLPERSAPKPKKAKKPQTPEKKMNFNQIKPIKWA